jgi:hypothetical protein
VIALIALLHRKASQVLPLAPADFTGPDHPQCAHLQGINGAAGTSWRGGDKKTGGAVIPAAERCPSE